MSKQLTPDEYRDQLEQKLRIDQEVREKIKSESRGPVPTLLAYQAHQLPTVQFPPRTPLLFRVDQVFLFSGQIGEVFATRGVGKTWFLLTLALLIAYGRRGMGFEAREPRRVLYVDGEMARQDIVERLVNLAERLQIELTPNDLFSNLTLIAADWQADPMPRVDTPEMQEALAPYVTDADVVIFDNRSCLFDPEGEKDPTAWQPTGEYLLSLRRLGKAVLLAHHANRQGGARGIGKAEDAMDIVINLARPADDPEAGATFTVSVQGEDGGKARGLWGPAAVPFTVTLTQEGWQMVTHDEQSGTLKVIEERIRTYLTQIQSVGEEKELPSSMNGCISNVAGNKAQKLEALAQMVKRGDVVQAKGRYRLADPTTVAEPGSTVPAPALKGKDVPF